MSGALTAISAIGGIAQQALPTLAANFPMVALFHAPRAFTGQDGTVIIPDVTIEESLSDRVTVTQHPIAKGTPIADHAFKHPATVTMRIGFSNSSIVAAATQGFLGASGGFGSFSSFGTGLVGAGQGLFAAATEQRCVNVYNQLRKMQFDVNAWAQGQVALQPFTLVTGKRTYPTMVMTELSVRTDRTTEYALMVECQMQEAIIISPSSTTQPAIQNMAKPADTASPANQPDQAPTPVAPPPSDPHSPLIDILPA